MMNLMGDFFALDIGTTAIRVVQLKHSNRAFSLVRYGSMPIDIKIAQSDSERDRQALSQAIIKLVGDSGISAKDVVVGIPSNRMFATVVDMPKLSEVELEKTIHYQAEQFIPTSLDESKIDWHVLGDSPAGDGKAEVLLASVPNTFAEARLDAVEATGLNVIALEPDGLGLVRALTPVDATGAVMILDIGNQATDLVVALNGGPRLIRSIPTGGEAFIKAAMQNLNIDQAQAQQFVYKFGLSKDKLEGQVFRALENTVETLVSEAQKSMKFFSNRYKDVQLDKVIVTGGASTLPEFPLHLANTLGTQVEIGNAWLNVGYPSNMQNELLGISNQFSTAVGLAERTS